MAKNNNKTKPVEPASFSTNEENKFIGERRINVKSDLIEITEDKLENILLKHLQSLGTRKAWITPLSISATITLACLTTTFVDKFGIKGTVWEALFILIAISSAIWSTFSIICLFLYWEKSSLTSLIKVIKNAKEEQTP